MVRNETKMKSQNVHAKCHSSTRRVQLQKPKRKYSYASICGPPGNDHKKPTPNTDHINTIIVLPAPSQTGINVHNARTRTRSQKIFKKTRTKKGPYKN